MESWLVGIFFAIAVFGGFGIVGVIKVMRKFDDPRKLAARFLCTRCNRYYNDIGEHLCYHRQD
jgi:hypothetical protein